MAKKDNLLVDASDLLKIIQQLCVSSKNQLAVVTNREFLPAVINLFIHGGQKEVEGALNLLFTLLARNESGVEMVAAKEKGNRGEQNVDEKGDVKAGLLSLDSEIIRQIEALLTGPHSSSECVKKLCSAVKWYLWDIPGE